MTQQTQTHDQFLDFWRKQIDDGTRAWTTMLEEAQKTDPTAVWRPFLDQSMATWAKLMTETPVTPELLGQWKTFLDQWIKAWASALEQAMGTETFARAMGSMAERYLDAASPVHKLSAQTTGTALDAVGLPSRDQVAGIARQVTDLDDRVDDLDDRIADLRARLDDLAARLTDDGRADERLDRLTELVEARLGTLDTHVAELGDRLDRALAGNGDKPAGRARSGGTARRSSSRSGSGGSKRSRSSSSKS